MRISILALAALGLASTAAAQMPLPSFNNTFTASLTRGFWFQAPANCFILGLSVPNEAGQVNQVVEVIDLGLAAPPAFPGTVVGTQLFYDNSTAAASIIPTAIPLISGNFYGILGACTSSVGGTTSYNSYGTPSGSFQSDILGIPTTITRFGTQFGIGGGGGNPCWQEAGGPIARVEVYVSATGSGTIATNTAYGTACGGNQRSDGSYYEVFSGGSIDLANTGFTKVWSGNGYVTIPGASAIVTPTGTPLTIGDDQVVPLALPSPFPCTPGIINNVYLSSNGWVSFEPTTNSDFSESVAELLNLQTRLAFLWDDLNPGPTGGGTVHAEVGGSGVFHITFTGVPEYPASGANNVQVSLNPNGDIEVKYGALSIADCLIGFSSGNGASDPGASDLSSALPIIVTTGFGPFSNSMNLAATSRPVIGTNWNLTTTGIDAVSPISLTFFGDRGAAVPLPVIGINAPGCDANLASVFTTLSAANVGGSSTVTVPVPNAPSLVGALLAAQSLGLSLSNPANIVVTNGVEGLVGDL